MAKRTIDFTKREQQLIAITALKTDDRHDPASKAAARANKKLKLINLVKALLETADLESLSATNWATLQQLAEEYTPTSKLEIKEGDDIITLLEQYKDVKDLYKKILKWCDENECQVQGTKIVHK